MDRRHIFKAFGAAALAVGIPGRAKAEADRAGKVVYHLADIEKVGFVLGNLQHHIDSARPGALALAVVVHGPALASFRLGAPNLGVVEDALERIKAGVVFHACAHTMAGMKLTLHDLLPGFAVAEKGGVVLLADLQAQGWIYLRP
jgi:intracellular sulfur oxidation DsrE/DsrF family protein